ncbi:TlpA family protein disulfide reductase [Sphingobacterium griseoflavum]|uniref:Thioredoxin domain-containing protein n=1 Tax=Sphingobacterium griseoflavum TaxID=1474952 RepID=A0ABQ3I330_9SPHI|nr:thioredoxin family protein [Sphingobacterium griseoflavum]GHE45535.1 hypothetical protein GCM10017764_30950 [Sphingobacterium griseoflavum]
MKKLTAYLICALLPMLLLAQQNSDTAAITDPAFAQHYASRPQPIIRGQILHASPGELDSLKIKYAIVNLRQPVQSSYEIEPDPDGSFEIIRDERLPNRQIWFTLGNYAYLCLLSDEELTLTFDLEKLKRKFVYWIGDGVEFGGKDADRNRTINKFIAFQQEQQPDISAQIASLEVSRPDYLTKLDSLFGKQDQLVEEFCSNNGDRYRTLIAGDSKADYYTKKLAYLRQNKISPPNIQELLTPIYAISNDSYGYIQALNFYLRQAAFEKTGQPLSSENLAQYYDDTLPPAYADLLKLHMGHPDVKKLTELYTALSPTLHFDWSRDYLDQQLADLRKKIAQIDSLSRTATINIASSSSLGSQLMKTQTGITLYRSPHKTGDSLLKDLQSVYSNKLVPIDIWATWCLPCIIAMPSARKLQEEAKAANLPIEFVYLCTSSGSDEEQWKNKVLEIQQPGTHLFVDSKAMSELMATFDKGGFPSYLLLKPNGRYDEETVNSLYDLQLDTLKDLLQ